MYPCCQAELEYVRLLQSHSLALEPLSMEAVLTDAVATQRFEFYKRKHNGLGKREADGKASKALPAELQRQMEEIVGGDMQLQNVAVTSFQSAIRAYRCVYVIACAGVCVRACERAHVDR